MAPVNDEISLQKFLGQIASDLYQSPGSDDQLALLNGYPEGIRPDADAVIIIMDSVQALKFSGARWAPYNAAPEEQARWGQFVWA